MGELLLALMALGAAILLLKPVFYALGWIVGKIIWMVPAWRRRMIAASEEEQKDQGSDGL